jgi:hypothetical protein
LQDTDFRSWKHRLGGRRQRDHQLLPDLDSELEEEKGLVLFDRRCKQVESKKESGARR